MLAFTFRSFLGCVGWFALLKLVNLMAFLAVDKIERLAVELVLQLEQYDGVHHLLDLDVRDELFTLPRTLHLALQRHETTADIVTQAEKADRV
jgi:hypothetical protein